MLCYAIPLDVCSIIKAGCFQPSLPQIAWYLSGCLWPVRKKIAESALPASVEDEETVPMRLWVTIHLLWPVPYALFLRHASWISRHLMCSNRLWRNQSHLGRTPFDLWLTCAKNCSSPFSWILNSARSDMCSRMSLYTFTCSSKESSLNMYTYFGLNFTGLQPPEEVLEVLSIELRRLLIHITDSPSWIYHNQRAFEKRFFFGVVNEVPKN